MHPLYQAVCEKILTTKNWFWSGHKKTYATSKPQIMNSVCFSIRPGATAQPLHRDDWCYHVVAQRADKYPDGLQRDTGIGFFVAAKRSTIQNGATRFIPGSHLWEHEREPDDDLAVHTELGKGSHHVITAEGEIPPKMKNGQLLHDKVCRTTRPSVFRTFLLTYCKSLLHRGWLRQEENHYLNMGLEKVKTLPRALQDICGYTLSEPFLGWVNSNNPRVVLDPSIKGNKDMHGTDRVVMSLSSRNVIIQGES
ncbi:hypothetical protein AC579_6798 [Pseudocercospora musae]|uniref:Uncharacterized protein n=1 Tax=Pseudocercospora musae TaxID=113226 RepID=A0A139IPY4_9PEZI|nr:hypothetical protein AC579_6798 [Pseudocercospora musae]KXT16832.1 hypothetical protein AC579_6798 [Pseudocercospora musae]